MAEDIAEDVNYDYPQDPFVDFWRDPIPTDDVKTANIVNNVN